MNKLQIHHRQAFATAHQRPPPSASRHDVAQRRAQKLVCPLAKSRRGQCTQCRACITRPATTARRTRIHQGGLGSDRKCLQINGANGSHGNEEGEGARALVCTYTGGEPRHALERDDKMLLSLQQLPPSDEDVTHHLSFLYPTTQWPTTMPTSA